MKQLPEVISKHIDEISEGDPSIAETIKKVANRILERREEATKLNSWEEIIDLECKELIENLLEDKTIDPLKLKGGIENVNNVMLALLRENIPVDATQIMLVDSLFMHFTWLIGRHGMLIQSKTHEETFNDSVKFIESAIIPRFQELTNELSKHKKKFNQLPDERRRELFLKATHRYFSARQSMKAKKGYTFVLALEMENAERKIIPSEEFDETFTEIVNHYKQWRYDNRDLVLEIERGYTA